MVCTISFDVQETTCSYCKGDEANLKDRGGPGQAVEEPHGGAGGEDQDHSSQSESQKQCSLPDICLCNETVLSVNKVSQEMQFFF